MNLMEELDNLISKEYGITLKEYRLVNVSGKIPYIEGQTGIITLTEQEVSFNLKKKTLTIKGENLIVKYFDDNTAMIEGHIIDVKVI